ncbi:beta-aspartyl-peptidase [Tissierella creatinophila]|uniref:Isoaspartyl dipeptidase n=1 Tax=Tissierella creatinophila DSM 6911 TaxID=1123403 RepID=A0A1U7M965_TISCR|nr:beta-aspartyl-peptidase [Tissierella creatinophila]OLS03821.1 isoaspartyl dipeptidase [Tissierella creatinophila DSM 6911]
MLLIKNVQVYSPEYIGEKDVLIVNEKISLIEDNIEKFSEKIKVIDGKDKILTPGLIDNHVHITGGGGEGSFKTRVPEITLSKLIEGGITTAIGLMGTDSTTRSVENLVAKAKALKEEGVSVYVHTGAYSYPSPTLTGEVKKDITFLEEIIGVKIALSDHRSSSLSEDELAHLASDARIAGMLSGKAGIVVAHMGDGEDGLGIVNRVLEKTEIPIRTIRPTHVNRKKELLMESFEYAKKGGIIDLTCGMSDELSPRKVIKQAKEKGVPLENITISSDGYGSFSDYDEYGNLLRIGVSSVKDLLLELTKMAKEENFDLQEALMFFTTNVAKALSLYPKKGIIKESSDADLLMLNKDIELVSVISKGKLMMNDSKIIVKGTYE